MTETSRGPSRRPQLEERDDAIDAGSLWLQERGTTAALSTASARWMPFGSRQLRPLLAVTSRPAGQRQLTLYGATGRG